MSTPKGAVVFVDQVLQVEIFLSPGYRFEDEEDGSVYSDGGDLDQFVPQREWPDKPLPEAPEPSISSPVQAPTTVSADRAQLIADLQAVHDATVKSLEAMGVNACEDYMQHKVDTILAKAGPGDTKCQICKKELKSTQNLRAHIISKHKGTKSPYKCQQCEETFGSTYALKLHMRRHSTSSKKYTCRVCTKVYFSIGHYNEHLKVHSGSQFICPWCSKVFQYKKNLNAHQQGACTKHPDDQPAPERHQCDYCYKSYAHKRDLQAHIKQKHLSQR